MPIVRLHELFCCTGTLGLSYSRYEVDTMIRPDFATACHGTHTSLLYRVGRVERIYARHIATCVAMGKINMPTLHPTENMVICRDGIDQVLMSSRTLRALVSTACCPS